MRNGIDFSSWQGLLSTLLSLAVVTLVFVGIRLLVMQTVQQRRERQNRQINERLRTLIAAYKTLVRDAVEAALSDVILLGTEEQVRLAAQAAGELAAGRPVETAELVVSLRTFIRQVLDLDPVPSVLAIPKQGPVRPSATGSRRGEKSDGGGKGGGGGGQGGGGGAGTGTGGAAPPGDRDAEDGMHH